MKHPTGPPRWFVLDLPLNMTVRSQYSIGMVDGRDFDLEAAKRAMQKSLTDWVESHVIEDPPDRHLGRLPWTAAR